MENEFDGHTIENLKVLRIALNSYLQGVLDTQKLMEDLWQKSIDLYEHKIALCDIAIEKKKAPDNPPSA